MPETLAEMFRCREAIAEEAARKACGAEEEEARLAAARKEEYEAAEKTRKRIRA